MHKIKFYYPHIIIACNILFFAYPFLYYHIALFSGYGYDNRYLFIKYASTCFVDSLFLSTLLVYYKFFYKNSNRVTKSLFIIVLLIFPFYVIGDDLISRMFCGPKIIRLTEGPFTYIERVLVNYSATNIISASPEEVALESFGNYPMYKLISYILGFVIVAILYIYLYSIFRSIKNKKGYAFLMLVTIFILLFMSHDIYY